MTREPPETPSGERPGIAASLALGLAAAGAATVLRALLGEAGSSPFALHAVAAIAVAAIVGPLAGATALASAVPLVWWQRLDPPGA